MTATITAVADDAGVAGVAIAAVTPRTSIDELVRGHLALVDHLVREVVYRVPVHVNRDDLTSAAMYALAAAARGFDPTLGVPFASFASLRIRGALTDELRSMDWASRSVRSRSRALDKMQDELTQTLGRQPSADELAAALDINAKELAALRSDIHRSTVLRTDAPGPAETVQALPDHGDSPESALLRREELGYLRDAIAVLPERQRIVVEQYFFGQRLMSDIARDLGVTESRVSQLRREALTLMREAMTDAADADTARTTDAAVPARPRSASVAAYCENVAGRSSAFGRLTSASISSR